jgi:hypothetical protein
LMDLDTTSIGFTGEKPAPASTNERNNHGYTKKPTSVRRKARDEPQASPAAAKTQRQRSDTTASKSETHGPRFFRLSTYVPFISSRVFFSHNAKPSGLSQDNHAVLEEMHKPHVASLVMTAGLVSMAATRYIIKPKQDPSSGMIELTIDGVDWPT